MRKTALLLLTVVPASAVAAQAPAVRLINTPTATSKPVLGNVAAVRQLSNGRLIVNDVAKRQLVMFDPTLSNATIIADSTTGGANSYGPAPGALISYFADSSLFIDPRDLSMFVLDPAGAIARVAAVPRSQDAGQLGSNAQGNPSFDSKGRLVYRGGFPRMGPSIVNGTISMPDMPDSAAIVRIDLNTRKLDTAAFFKITKNKMNMVQNEKGMMMTNEINPMQVIDDWAVLSDGSIAIVRGRDYHIDWVNPNGGITATAKLPFEWQRLSDEDKVAVIDSVKAAMEKMRSSMGPIGAGGNQQIMAGRGGGGGEPGAMVMQFRTTEVGGAIGDAKRAGAEAMSMPPLAFVAANELPDYRPAFSTGAAKADLDGNLWIRTSAVRAGAIAGPIYDVVNGKGELTDRVQVPAGRQIIGFGQGGVIYMVARDDKGSWIEKTKRSSTLP